ncbi:hypothetical protein EDD37DRAFT_187380 [Exophiala viscosa]|uniref:uncharacterized protein n=1 Tax=Exophiala viscosa TaxID=2486360 RepID=UPI00218D6DE0|nr:hypothetical protein EDD37DRAFT_187380 [Exophiala viscosa]
MFALSCRFLSPHELGGLTTQQCVDVYTQHTIQTYKDARSIETPPTLAYLQGCVLLAFNYYTSGLNFQGWICVGVCVRLAYELGIADIDSEEDEVTIALDWVEKEERRRAWWLVWELDTFGSSISKRPFSTDWRRAAVKLPVSDQAWFATQEVDAPRLPSRWGNIQTIFDEMPQTDARPWFLLAQLLNVRAHEYLQQNVGVSLDERTILENEINCLRLGLPSSFNLLSNQVDSSAYETSNSNWNWIVGTNLLLSSTSYIIRNLVVDERDGGDLGICRHTAPNGRRTRAVELTKITSYWPLEFFPTSHPFLACLLLTVDVRKGWNPTDTPLSTSSNIVTKMIQHKLGGKWRLASLALRMNEILGRPTDLSSVDMQLIHRYPVWFSQELRREAAAALTRQSNQQEQASSTSREGTRPACYDYFKKVPPVSLFRAGKETPSSHSSTLPNLQGAPGTHEGNVEAMEFWNLDFTNCDFQVPQDMNEPEWPDAFLDAPIS